jgi:hypothetical protein
LVSCIVPVVHCLIFPCYFIIVSTPSIQYQSLSSN